MEIVGVLLEIVDGELKSVRSELDGVGEHTDSVGWHAHGVGKYNISVAGPSSFVACSCLVVANMARCVGSIQPSVGCHELVGGHDKNCVGRG